MTSKAIRYRRASHAYFSQTLSLQVYRAIVLLFTLLVHDMKTDFIYRLKQANMNQNIALRLMCIVFYVFVSGRIVRNVQIRHGAHQGTICDYAPVSHAKARRNASAAGPQVRSSLKNCPHINVKRGPLVLYQRLHVRNEETLRETHHTEKYSFCYICDVAAY